MDLNASWSSPTKLSEQRDGSLPAPLKIADVTPVWPINDGKCTNAGRPDSLAQEASTELIPYVPAFPSR
jgi:hypothetical protein